MLNRHLQVLERRQDTLFIIAANDAISANMSEASTEATVSALKWWLEA